MSGPGPKRWGAGNRRPPPSLVEAVARQEAERAGVTFIEVIGDGRTKAAIEARRRAWMRLVLEERFPILGVSLVWGCERRGIQRALKRVAA